MEKEFSCFFTGHRFISENEYAYIKNVLHRKIRALIEDKGITDFIAGGALGFDMAAEKTVLELKKEYDYINLHLYLPCYNNMQKWTSNQQYEGRLIMSKADVLYVTEGKYTDGCTKKRNIKMADDALYCIAYCTHPRSGSYSTLCYAKKAGNYIDNIGVYGGGLR